MTSFVIISFEFPVPELAPQWSTWLVEDINEYIRERVVRSARTRSRFLQEQLGKTSVADIRNILFHLIQNEMQNELLAETREEFVLETIDPAIAPELKSRPRRSLIVVIGTGLGGLLSLLIIFIQHSIKNRRGSVKH